MDKRFKQIILPNLSTWFPDGIHREYDFGNGWGASVICRKDASYGGAEGLWEIAPLRFGELLQDKGFDIGLYDIKGYLNDAQLQEELHKIKDYVDWWKRRCIND